MPLQVGDTAPDQTSLVAHNGEVKRATLAELRQGRKGLVLVSYALDFTGG
jgi:alkyl hydroperoxide reductase subunit AhpC